MLQPGLEDNNSFHLNLVIQLDALVGETVIPINIDKRKQPYIRYMAISLHDYVWSRIAQNGSNFFNNASSPIRGEYFPSYKPSQPIGRASWWGSHS